jgi:alkanesulfonate monooxygenase SsuD/methylene tetrahydromethanopterin reductase-like flavin-dependent oxidoreductase (luciferase family)
VNRCRARDHPATQLIGGVEGDRVVERGQRRVRFGVQLQAQRTTWPDFQRGLGLVEELGYDTVFTFDHLLPVNGPTDGSCFETLTTLAAMATLTQRIRIGVLCGGVMYRDPATLAKAAAMVDQISGGRLEFTLGPAWAEREFRTYGLDFPRPGERLRRLDEALTIIKSLWTEPRTTFAGRYYSVTDAPCEPKPLQRPYPPILIGGARAGTMRLTAKHADAWNGIGSAAFCAERIAAIEGFCKEIGRDPAEIEYSAHPELAIAPTHDEAEEIATRVAAGHGRQLEGERSLWVLGTPDEVREQVRAYVEVGVTHLIFAVPHPFERAGLELFAREVAPAFR